jgi:hypothetical protein
MHALLFDSDLCARRSLAGKSASLNLAEVNDTVFGGVNRKVSTHERTWAGNLSRTGLTYQYFSGADGLSTEAFDTQSGTGIVVDVLRRTTSFDV